jgi:hypothetical protein
MEGAVIANTPSPALAGHDLIRRVQGEFKEMPGLKLTPAQAQRLFGLDSLQCESLLDALTHEHFLTRTRDGAYVLAPGGR